MLIFDFYKIYFRYISHGLLNQFNEDEYKCLFAVYKLVSSLLFIIIFYVSRCLWLKKRLEIIDFKISVLTVIRN